MKKYLFLIIMNFFFWNPYFILSYSTAQDTSYVLLSSNDYDYKNPQFDKSGSSVNYSIKDCIFAYEKWSSGTNSKIAVRFMKHNFLTSETELTDSSSLNINPSVAYNIEQFTQSENNPGSVVFQSNRAGNWDIYLSHYNSISWSTPVAIAAGPSDEVEPCIVPYKINNVLNFLITYRKNNDIYLKNFFNGIWMNEVNITSGDSLNCFTPQITKNSIGSQNEFFIAYNKKINSLINSISYQRIFVNLDGTFNNVLTRNITQPNSQNNIRFSNGVNYSLLNYDYDTPGRKDFYSAFIRFNDYTIWNQSNNFNGNNFGGTGSSHGDITSDFPNGYTLFSWIRKVNDSTKIMITRYSFPQGLKEYYVGDSTVNTFVNTSTKLVFGSPFTFYRIRILWEKEINGRTALIEAFQDGYLTSVNNEHGLNPENFILSENYPNPFNPRTVISYQLPSSSDVLLTVYDGLGKEVATLVNQKQNAGSYEVEFSGEGLSSGIYFYKLEADDFVETKRMILLK